SGYDLVLLSHVTHDESPEMNARLLAKAHAALSPGGRVAIDDFVVDEEGCGPPFAARFSINMLIYTRGGRVYSLGEYQRMIEDAPLPPAPPVAILPERGRSSTVLVVGER